MESVNELDDKDNLPNTGRLENIISEKVKELNVDKNFGRNAGAKYNISNTTMKKVISELPIKEVKGKLICNLLTLVANILLNF
jgi:hypothetical protein